MEHSLTKFGFDPYAEASRLNRLSVKDRVSYLNQELQAHELHVVRNHVVSIPYDYWLSNDGRIFTNPERTIELESDENERGGIYKIGLPKALTLAKSNPNQLVFHYSPTGPASFTEPPHPKYAKPYDIGQLSLMFFDGDKITNISISLNINEFDFLKEIFGKRFLTYTNFLDNRERIEQFVTHPVLVPGTIDDWLSNNWKESDMVIFHSNSFGKENFFDINDVKHEIRNSLAGNLKGQINTELIAAQAILNGGGRVRPADMDWAFKAVIGGVMQQEGVSIIAMGGSCGGSTVTSSDIFESYNPVQELQNKFNLSSGYRNSLQVSSNEDSDEYGSLKFPCPNPDKSKCGKIITRPRHTLLPKCPHCGFDVTCA